MISEKVRKAVETDNIKDLRYMFIDSLDVDPTFDKYREDYEYSKKQDDFFEPHKELSSITNDQLNWDKAYFDKIKSDLSNNFSEIRFEHLITVAKVVYSDKISRLLKERDNNSSNNSLPVPRDAISINSYSNTDCSTAEQAQKKRLEELKKDIENNNLKADRNIQEQKKKVEDSKKKYSSQHTKSDISIKKALGIALAAVVVIIVAILVIKALS